QRDVECVARPDEPRGLVRRVREKHTTFVARLVGEDADGAPAKPRVTGHELSRPELLDLEPAAVVDQRLDEVDDVEGDWLACGDDLGDASAGCGRTRLLQRRL